MELKKFVSLFENSLKDFIRSPFIAVFGAGLFFLVFVLSFAGGKIGYLLQTTSSNIIWLVLFGSVFFVIGGFFSAGFIGVCEKIVKREKIGDIENPDNCFSICSGFSNRHSPNRSDTIKGNVYNFFISGKKFWFRNLLVLVLFLAFFQLINLVLFGFTKIMILASGNFAVPISAFRFLSVVIVFIFLAGIVIFLTFSNAFIVVKNLRFAEGVRESVGLVKKEYFATLAMSIIFFAVIYLLGRVNNIIGDLISYFLILPFVFLVLTRFVLESS